MLEKRMWFLVLGLTWAAVGLVTNGDPIPVGGSFPISTDSGVNLPGGVAIDPAAGFVVTWENYDPKLMMISTLKRRFLADGGPLDSPTLVNSARVESLQSDVVIAPSGEHEVVWHGLTSDALSLRRYAADGSTLEESEVATGVDPAMAQAPNGDLVIVWIAVPSPSLRQVRGRRLASDGSPLGADFDISALQVTSLLAPRIDMDSVGDFVVTWMAGSDGVVARRFLADGTPKDSSFQVPTLADGASTQPDVAMQPDGGFLIVWTSDGSLGTDTDMESIAGRRYAADGTALGDQFQVNTEITRSQVGPAIASDARGEFIVAWRAKSQIRGQRLDSAGAPLGGEFEVADSSLNAPVVAAEPDGDFVVAWADYVTSGIRGRLYRANVLFEDGFELGNTSSWSSATP